MILYEPVHPLLCPPKHQIVEGIVKENPATTRESRPNSLSRIHYAIPQITINECQAKRTRYRWQAILKVAFDWDNYILQPKSSDFLLHVRMRNKGIGVIRYCSEPGFLFPI